MNTHSTNTNLAPSFELSGSERLQLETLQQENSILRKLKAEISIKNQRDSYESTATIRKQAKQIEKLQLEINALKVASSGTTLEIFSNEKTITRLPIKALRHKAVWQGENLSIVQGS